MANINSSNMCFRFLFKNQMKRYRPVKTSPFFPHPVTAAQKLPHSCAPFYFLYFLRHMNVFINNNDICVCFKLSHNWYPTGASSCIVFWPLALLTSLGLVGAPPCHPSDPCSGLCLLPWPPSLSQLFCVYRPRAPKGLSHWNWVFDAENSGFWPLWCQR